MRHMYACLCVHVFVCVYTCVFVCVFVCVCQGSSMSESSQSVPDLITLPDTGAGESLIDIS